MLSRGILAVDAGTKFIKLIYGENIFGRITIKKCGLIETPEKAIDSGRINQIEKVFEALIQFIKMNNIKARDISFAIQGNDIVIRYAEVPIMDEKNIRDAVEWEIKQYLPENGERHYIDFEVQHSVLEADKKAYRVMVAAVPRDIIDNYVALTDMLKLRLRAIDISANSAARIFRLRDGENSQFESIGIIDIGFSSSRIVILENGRLFMEREVPFGINNVIKEVSRKLQVNEEESLRFITDSFDIAKVNENDEVERRILTLFDNVLSTFLKIIQFYATGKTKKTLDKIYLIGGGCEIKGIEDYIKDSLGSEASIVKSFDMLKSKVKFNETCDAKLFVNAFGLLLRKE